MKYLINTVWIVAALVLVSAIGNMQAGCKQENRKESLQQIDSLEGLTSQEDELTNIDEDGIKTRYDSMNIKLNFIREHFGMVISDSLKNNMLQYMAIRSNYKKFLEVFPGMEYDAKEDKKRIDNLKHDYISHAISEGQFQQYFSKEKPLLNKHIFDLKNVARSIYSVERQFDRSDDVMTEVYDILVKRLKPTAEELKAPAKEKDDDDDDGK